MNGSIVFTSIQNGCSFKKAPIQSCLSNDSNINESSRSKTVYFFHFFVTDLWTNKNRFASLDDLPILHESTQNPDLLEIL